MPPPSTTPPRATTSGPAVPTKFSAVAGYDLCTGWGTPNGTNLINALAGPPILAPFVVSNSLRWSPKLPQRRGGPAETVTVNFGLKNIGTAEHHQPGRHLAGHGRHPLSQRPANLRCPQHQWHGGGQPFTFTATGSCGGTNTASLQLQDGAANLGTVTFSFRLGQPSVSTVFSQNFDGVTAPALPAGWTTSTSGAESAWVTSTSARDTTPNSAFSPDPASVGVNELDSPAITSAAGSAQLTFPHNYNLETSYDGGVLEIKIGGGAWTDILTAGGSFVSGGYKPRSAASLQQTRWRPAGLERQLRRVHHHAGQPAGGRLRPDHPVALALRVG
jgi:hypothetical protein